MMFSTILSIAYVIVSTTVFILIWGWWYNGYFKRKGVPSPPAYLPLLGNVANFLGRTDFNDFADNIYKMHPKDRYTGIIQFNQVVVYVRDTELLKQITMKDFEYFTDRLISVDENVDVLFGKSVFSLRGQKWREMRSTLSPAFTSAKIKGIFQLILDAGDQMTKYFSDQIKTPENRVRGLIELEMKDVFSRYTNDVIATCVFGLEVNSFVDTANEFYMNGKEASDLCGLKLLKFTSILFAPRLSKLLGIQLFSKKIVNFYRSLILNTIKDREEIKLVRQDMIQLLLEAKSGTLKHESKDMNNEVNGSEENPEEKKTYKRIWTDDEIVAQAMLFILAGFDLPSAVLAFLTHELAANLGIQKRLQEEIDEVVSSTDGQLTYDSLQKMKYLDMVVSETLRLYPPSLATERRSVKPYTLPPSRDGGKEFHIQPGTGIWIAIYSIHRDPENFKDPDKFDPERFSDENKHNIKPCSYIPFGAGSRNCLGSRFAPIVIKAAICNILLKFDIVPTAKTQIPIKLKRKSLNLHPENGIWLGLKPRNL